MVGDELQQIKQAARARARHILSKLNPKRRGRAALDASRALRNSSIWTTCDCLLAYMALDTELSCAPVIQLALNDNKKVFTPKMLAGKIVFFRIFSNGDSFARGPFGIREPVTRRDESEMWEPGKESSLVLTPGLLFDEEGGRLGRGEGFFDRFILGSRLGESSFAVTKPLFIGYAYDEQIVKRVPMGSRDERLDGVLSDRRFLRYPSR